MPNAYAAIDAQHERELNEAARIEAIIESAISDLEASLNATLAKTRRILVNEAMAKLKELEG